MVEIGIIVPSYNNSNYLEKCIKSIFSKINSENFKIMIVDNASQDEKVKELLANLEKNNKIFVLKNLENLGFGRAINLGMNHLHTKCKDIKYIIVLNQDTQILNDIFREIITFMENQKDIGICGPRLFNHDGTIQNSFYTFPSISKKTFQLLGLKRLSSIFIKCGIFNKLLPSFASSYLKNFSDIYNPIEVPWITGACMIIKKRVFEDIGGFDENYKMYSEEMDFCLRARKNGWKIYYVPQAEVLHYMGWKSSKYSREMVNIFYDSLAYFYKKYYHGLGRNVLLFLNEVERRRKLKRVE